MESPAIASYYDITMNENIPDPSVRRLSAYLRQLEHLKASGVDHVSSRQLAERLNVGAAMVRRDLALFGQFGRRGVGYAVEELIDQIQDILGTQTGWSVIAIGAGMLCQALMRYTGFTKRGFKIVAAFDDNPELIGQKIGEVPVYAMSDLKQYAHQHSIRLAILTVPASAAQICADQLVQAGIEGILNFATAGLDTPEHVHSTPVDITAHLEQLSFHVSQDSPAN